MGLLQAMDNLLSALYSFPGGYLSDRIGAKRSLLIFNLVAIVAVLLAVYSLPVGMPRFDNAVHEALQLAKWYAREHVLLSLIPAFFIAGAIGVFVNQNSVLGYLGSQAGKVCAYGVASCSGTILAVCSCTILPLFAGIYCMGAGIGPATAFLYSGPATSTSWPSCSRSASWDRNWA